MDHERVQPALKRIVHQLAPFELGLNVPEVFGDCYGENREVPDHERADFLSGELSAHSEDDKRQPHAREREHRAVVHEQCADHQRRVQRQGPAASDAEESHQVVQRKRQTRDLHRVWANELRHLDRRVRDGDKKGREQAGECRHPVSPDAFAGEEERRRDAATPEDQGDRPKHPDFRADGGQQFEQDVVERRMRVGGELRVELAPILPRGHRVVDPFVGIDPVRVEPGEPSVAAVREDQREGYPGLRAE